MEISDPDLLYMKKALELAQDAFDEDEVPIGAVITIKNKIIGKGYNQTEKLKDITAHAEMIALTAASSYLGSKYMNECTLYVTIEPCVMCAGAIKNARFEKVVYGASEPKTGYSHFLKSNFNPRTEVIKGVLEKECREMMQLFFRMKREENS